MAVVKQPTLPTVKFLQDCEWCNARRCKSLYQGVRHSENVNQGSGTSLHVIPFTSIRKIQPASVFTKPIHTAWHYVAFSCTEFHQNRTMNVESMDSVGSPESSMASVRRLYRTHIHSFIHSFIAVNNSCPEFYLNRTKM